jgi:hypothetical protein
MGPNDHEQWMPIVERFKQVYGAQTLLKNHFVSPALCNRPYCLKMMKSSHIVENKGDE